MEGLFRIPGARSRINEVCIPTCACVRACVCVCVRACVRMCMCVWYILVFLIDKWPATRDTILDKDTSYRWSETVDKGRGAFGWLLSEVDRCVSHSARG